MTFMRSGVVSLPRLAPQGAACLAMVFAFVFVTTPSVWAQADDIGTVKTLTGSAEIRRGAQSVRAEIGSAVKRGDVVRTAAASTVGITLRDNTILSAGANSELALDKFRFDAVTQKGEMETTLKKGTLSGISGAVVKNSPDAVKFKTSTVTLGVRGTSFIIEAADRGEQ